MYVTVLGPVRAFDGDREVDLGGPSNRALVARLALDAGRPVSARVLIENLWGVDVPADATNALQSIVSRTRRRLPAGRTSRRASCPRWTYWRSPFWTGQRHPARSRDGGCSTPSSTPQ